MTDWEDDEVQDHQLLQRMNAVKTTPKVRKPEEVWYDVHKHPEGVPGGMGKSPEHHLRNRGWSGHEIHGATSKTIQYHNPKYPDFVISYGGGSPQKPDHNFRVLYLGASNNVPKINRAYSVAEAMNKVEELHELHSGGFVVQPMIHGAASIVGPKGYPYAIDDLEKLRCPSCHGDNIYSRGFRMSDDDADLACNDCKEKFHSPTGFPVEPSVDWEEKEDQFGGRRFGAAPTAKTPTKAQQPNVSLNNTFIAPGDPVEPPEMGTNDNAYPIGPPKPEFPTQPDREHDWPKKNKPQLKEIPDPPAYGGNSHSKRVARALRMAKQASWEDG